MKQKTIGNSFSLTGIGLHTGVIVCLTAHPSPAGSGIKIKRVDLEGEPEIPALVEYVGDTLRGTVLIKDGVRVSTIEHALAAFYAAGIDNCLFTVNGPEFPILDGSSYFYCQKLAEVGMVEQELDKDFLIVDEVIEYVCSSGSVIKAFPSDKMEFEVQIGFNSAVLKNQTAHLSDLSTFATDFAPARTFVFVREIEPLLQMNLIKGGDLKNAIVIYDTMMSQEKFDLLTDKLQQPRMDASKPGYLSGPLKYDNEPARHKLLDLIGDLALLGKPFKGKISALYPGHRANTAFAALMKHNIKLKQYT